MAIDELDMIDGIGTDHSTGEVVLVISDHFNWSDEQKHLSVLQAKINAYFRFVESGQIFQRRPDAKEAGMRIDCMCSFEAPASTAWFAEEVRKTAAPLNLGFTFKTLPPEFMPQEAKQ